MHEILTGAVPADGARAPGSAAASDTEGRPRGATRAAPPAGVHKQPSPFAGGVGPVQVGALAPRLTVAGAKGPADARLTVSEPRRLQKPAQDLMSATCTCVCKQIHAQCWVAGLLT